MTTARPLFWAVLVVSGLCFAPQQSRAIDVKLLPEKTEIVLRVNIKQILNSEVGKSKNVKDLVKEIKDAFNQFPGSDQALKYLEKMGLNPAKDLSAVTMAHTGAQKAEDLFIVVEGNFDPMKIEATARESAKEFGNLLGITRLNDVTVLEVKAEKGGVFIGLLGKKTIVATGSQEALKDAIARSLGNSPAVLKKDVEDLLKTVNDKQSVSFVVSSRVMAAVGKMGGAIGPAMPALDGGLSGSITLAKEVNFQLGLAAKDKATARDLVDKGNLGLFLLKALVAQQAQQNPQMGPLVDVVASLRLVNVGNNAVLEGEVTYEALQQMFKSVGDQFKGK